MHNKNRERSRILACLADTAPDVALIQEALPNHLEALSERFKNVVVARDYIMRGEPCYLAIASNSDLLDIKVSEHFGATKAPPSLFARISGWVEFLDTLSAKVAIDGNTAIQVVVVHTSAAASPTIRASEVDAALTSHTQPDGPTVFAGDFNCYSEPWLAPIVALPLAYGIQDLLIRERRKLEARMANDGFKPSVRGVTYPRFRAQMDQVFVRGMRILASSILPDHWGSDHKPILVQVSIADGS